jgi:small subunit ribosomal protein S3
MTHTAHPYAHRLGILRDWKSRWFANGTKQYRDNLKIDTSIREFLKKRLRSFYVGSLEIERNANNVVRIIIKTSRPGLIIGRSGEELQKLLLEIKKNLKKLKLAQVPEIKVDVEEIKSPESNAQIVALMVAEGLEKRMPFKRVMKSTVEKVMANRDVQGVRIKISGRLNGADMARKEEIRKGRVPLQTLRADIDFARERANIPQGVLGIKVWIYKGEVLENKK